MTSPIDFRYPGDDPGSLGIAATQLDVTGTRIERIIQAVSLSRSALKNAWTMQATDLADADIGLLVNGLPTVRAALQSAHDAVIAHQTTLSRIRSQIDDLQTQFRQQEHAIDAAEQDVNQLVARTDPMAALQREGFVAAGRAAVATQQSIVEQYRQLVAQANASAEGCAESLRTAWDPTGQSPGPNSTGLGPGSLLLGQAGISVGTLNLLRIDAEVTEAGTLAADIAALGYLDGTDPGLQAKIARLAQIWNAESANGVFASAFYGRLGGSATVDLMARIGAVIAPDGYLDSGPLTQALIHDLQADMANGLSAATQGLEYAPDGSLVDTIDGGLGPAWLGGLMQRARSDLNVPFKGQPIQIKGYVPLMATLAAGSNYSAGLLKALGDDLRDLEVQHQIDNSLESGDEVWASNAPSRVRWNWTVGGSDFPMGNDPFTSWTTAMDASPGAGRAVLANDRDLLNHLINDRSWLVDDSRSSDDPAQWLYRTTDLQEPRQGLVAFGDALARIIGPGAANPDAARAFGNVVALVGSNDSNPLINSGAFETTDWIPPELRPGLGDLVTLNIDAVHDAFVNTEDRSAYSVLLADLAKDQGTNPFADRLMASEATLIAAHQQVAPFRVEDLAGQMRIAATVAHGHVASDVGLQMRADAEHNNVVDTLAFNAHFAASGAGLIPLVGSPAQFLADSIIDAVADANQDDNELVARNDAAEWKASFSAQLADTTRNQVYGAGFAQLPPVSGAEVPLLFDDDGRRLRYDQLSAAGRDWVTANWTAGMGATPSQAASDAITAFDARDGSLVGDLNLMRQPR